ncbi:MAG: N-acetylmuramoyl-L-alanine amidase [Pseudomonadota bacterium]
MANNKFFSKSGWLLIILFSFISLAGHAASITNIRVNHFDNYTRVVFNVTGPEQYNVFTLTSPHRVVVDFSEGHLRTNLKEINFGDNTDILHVRSGRPVPSMLRIVFDVAGAVSVKSSFIPDNNPGEGQLVVDFFQKTAHAQATPAIVPATAAATTVAEPKPLPVATVKTVTNVEPATKPVVQIKTVTKTVVKKTHKIKPQLVESLKPHLIVVVIDPGHGGKDSGTIGRHGSAEKDIVLAIAQRLAELINSQPNMRAVLTRNGDYFVTLHNRLMLSRQSKADLFIAIHADSYFNDQSIGASVYALSRNGASSMAARWLADRENHSELGGVDLNELGDKSYILRSVLIDLAQTATITDSIKLGTDVLDGLENVTTLHYPQVEQAPFMVLKSPDIPSVLVETGFLSNPKEEERLQQVGYRDKLAHALLAGIHSYMISHPMMATSTRPETTT